MVGGPDGGTLVVVGDTATEVVVTEAPNRRVGWPAEDEPDRQLTRATTASRESATATGTARSRRRGFIGRSLWEGRALFGEPSRH